MQQSPFQEANQFSASQEIPRILRNPKVHYSVIKYYARKLIHELLKNQFFFDVRHVPCVITKLNSNWETVINTTKVYYYS
jgi:hypothetical protein